MKREWRVFGLVLGLSACTGPGGVAATPADHKGTSNGGSKDTGPTVPSAAESSNNPGPAQVDDAGGEQPPGSSADESSSSEMSAAGGTAPVPVGTKVLHVGDSFAGALGLPLGSLLEEAGVQSVLKHTDSSYLTDWAWNGELQKMLWKYNPDLLIITLGANELSITEPEQRQKTVQKIMSLVGDRPCLWVAIPLWQGKHNGLMDVIHQNLGSCVYWDSNQLLDVQHMARISDGIHPTTEARAAWAQVVFDWLKGHRQPTKERPWALAP